jgi:iodotyrosine deiodinase
MSYRPVPYRPDLVSAEESVRRLREIYREADARRTVRMFSSREVPREAIELAILTAGTAPSGAHLQPWHFVAISDPGLKQRIRDEAEREEKEFYERRITPEWRDALEPLGTDFVKAHVTEAPWLLVVFRRDYDVLPDGTRRKNYYMTESVGIAVGFMIQALHRAGLATLTHTPAPMTFLREVCGRPANEKPFVLMPVGYPAEDCLVPDLRRKTLDEIAEFR